MKKSIFIKPSMMVSAFVIMTAISPLKAVDLKDIKNYLREKQIEDNIQSLNTQLSDLSDEEWNQFKLNTDILLNQIFPEVLDNTNKTKKIISTFISMCTNTMCDKRFPEAVENMMASNMTMAERIKYCKLLATQSQEKLFNPKLQEIVRLFISEAKSVWVKLEMLRCLISLDLDKLSDPRLQEVLRIFISEGESEFDRLIILSHLINLDIDKLSDPNFQHAVKILIPEGIDSTSRAKMIISLAILDKESLSKVSNPSFLNALWFFFPEEKSYEELIQIIISLKPFDIEKLSNPRFPTIASSFFEEGMTIDERLKIISYFSGIKSDILFHPDFKEVAKSIFTRNVTTDNKYSDAIPVLNNIRPKVIFDNKIMALLARPDFKDKSSAKKIKFLKCLEIISVNSIPLEEVDDRIERIYSELIAQSNKEADEDLGLMQAIILDYEKDIDEDISKMASSLFEETEDTHEEPISAATRSSGPLPKLLKSSLKPSDDEL